MFTSRAECRLALRHDNADRRLEPYGRELGLVGDSDWERFHSKRDRLAHLSFGLSNTRLTRSDPAYAALSTALNSDLGDSVTLSQVAQRPGVSSEMIRQLLPRETYDQVSLSELESALADSLYAGYIEGQATTVKRLYQHDGLKVPTDLRYGAIDGLSHEMIERFELASSLADARIALLPPQGYLEMLGLLAGASLVLTDSGGIQEETTALGVPCLTMRENTERPITVEQGTNTVVGRQRDRIRGCVEEILSGRGKRGRIPELWDGHTAERIAEHLAAWLLQRNVYRAVGRA